MSGVRCAARFTHTLARSLAAGIPVAGEYLRCADLQPALTGCPGQDSAHLAFTTSGSLTDPGDPGLWLLPNPARKG